jgi:hypothetical protein
MGPVFWSEPYVQGFFFGVVGAMRDFMDFDFIGELISF